MTHRGIVPRATRFEVLETRGIQLKAVEDDSGRAFDCFEDLPNLPNTLTMKNHKQQVHKGDKVKVRLIFNKRRRNDIPDFELCALEVL